MNWFKKAFVPFVITSYNSNGDMTVRFNNNDNRFYTYYNVNNRTYHKLESLLKNKNFPEASKILKSLSKEDRLKNIKDNHNREKQMEFDF